MRVLLIGSTNPANAEACTARALERAGHQTLVLDDRRISRKIGRRLTQRWVLARARRFRPDFVVLAKCLRLDLDTVYAIIRDTPNALWYHDAQWYDHAHLPEIKHVVDVGRMTEVFFVSGFDAEWRALGLPAKFLPSAADVGIVPEQQDPRFVSEVAFIGSAYDATRGEFLVRLARHHDVRVYGPGWEAWRDRLRWYGKSVHGRDFARVCSSAAITLGINPAAAHGATTYTSDRVWMAMLAGAFYMGHGTPGMDALVRGGEHCAWYADVDDCIEKVRYYVQHPAERERIRAAGEAFVRQHHTFDQRIPNLLSGNAWVSPLGQVLGHT